MGRVDGRRGRVSHCRVGGGGGPVSRSRDRRHRSVKRKRKTRLLRERRRAQPRRALACGEFVRRRLGLVDAEEEERGAAREEVLRLLESCRGHALGRACLRDRLLTRLHSGPVI